MGRALVLLSVVLMLGSNAVAATDVSPGLVGPDDALYEVDVLIDDVTSGVLKPPGEAAHERASEACVAAEMNDTVAMDRALTELERVANRTNGVESSEGLQKAEQVLPDLRDRVPDQATFGIDTAIESITRAKNRFPTDQLPNDQLSNDTGPVDAVLQ